MAAKINWRRYGTKLRHSHPMYTCRLLASQQQNHRHVTATRRDGVCLPLPDETRFPFLFEHVQRKTLSHKAGEKCSGPEKAKLHTVDWTIDYDGQSLRSACVSPKRKLFLVPLSDV